MTTDSKAKYRTLGTKEEGDEKMASIFSRVLNSYTCLRIKNRVVPPAVALALLFIIIRWASSPSGQVWTAEETPAVFQQLDEGQIKGFLDSMTDTRSDECKAVDYDIKSGKHEVSIILDFHEKQFYDLKLTLESIVRHTPEDLYKDIIILDDGSGSAAVQQEVKRYLTNGNFRKVKAFRSDAKDGSSLSRFKASKVAEGSILVFLSSETAVNKGWLEPLLSTVLTQNKVIAVPHFDNILSGYRFFQTPDGLISVFNWKLSTLFMETKLSGPLLDTPVMTGAAFAIKKVFLDGIGSFDESMGSEGGESLELSFRTWLCGGSIKIVPCSRVALKNALVPHHIKSAKSFRRITELWLDSYKRAAYRQGGHPEEMDESERIALRMRQNYFKKTINCMPFHKYLDKVAKDVAVLPATARFFGPLRTNTGYCLEDSTDKDGHVKMHRCRPHIYEPSKVYMMDFKGRLIQHGGSLSCLQLETDNSIKLAMCQNIAQQKWVLEKDGMLHNAEQKGVCLEHIRGTSNEEYLGTGECRDDRALEWSFNNY